jgi:hypothetical protein
MEIYDIFVLSLSWKSLIEIKNKKERKKQNLSQYN